MMRHNNLKSMNRCFATVRTIMMGHHHHRRPCTPVPSITTTTIQSFTPQPMMRIHNNNNNNSMMTSCCCYYHTNIVHQQQQQNNIEDEHEDDDNIDNEPMSLFDRIIYMVQLGSIKDNEQELEQLLEDCLVNDDKKSEFYGNRSKQIQLMNAVFSYAIDCGNVAILQYILNRHNNTSNSNELHLDFRTMIDMDGESLLNELESAIGAGGERRVPVVQLLMNRLCEMDPTGKLSFRHLLTHVYSGDLAMTKFLLENYYQNSVFFHSVNPNHQNRETGNTILHLAAQNFRVDTVRYLLEEQKHAKIQMNHRNVSSFTPLESLIHRVVLRSENRQAVDTILLKNEEHQAALETAALLDKHGSTISNHAIIERAGSDFVLLLEKQYEAAKENFEESVNFHKQFSE